MPATGGRGTRPQGVGVGVGKNQGKRRNDENVVTNTNTFNQNASTSRGIQGGNRRGNNFGYRNRGNHQYYWNRSGNDGSQGENKGKPEEHEKGATVVAQKTNKSFPSVTDHGKLTATQKKNRGPLPDWDEVAEKDDIFDYMDMMEQQYAQFYAIAGAPFDAAFDPNNRINPPYPIGVRQNFGYGPAPFMITQPRQFVPTELQPNEAGTAPTDKSAAANDELKSGSRPESPDSSLTTSIPATPTPLLSPDPSQPVPMVVLPSMQPPRNIIMAPIFSPPFISAGEPGTLKDSVRRQM